MTLVVLMVTRLLEKIEKVFTRHVFEHEKEERMGFESSV